MASKGDPTALAKLAEEPPMPEEMEYLVEWATKLHGRSGAHMAGPMPVSHQEIEAFARLWGLGKLDPLEVEALVMLDLAMLNKPEQETRNERQVKLNGAQQRPSLSRRR